MSKSETEGNSTVGTAAWLIVGVLAVYFFVESYFPKSIVCRDGVSESVCECVRYSVAKKVPFIDKLRILTMGASAEELNSYMNLADNLGCAMRGLTDD